MRDGVQWAICNLHPNPDKFEDTGVQKGGQEFMVNRLAYGLSLDGMK